MASSIGTPGVLGVTDLRHYNEITRSFADSDWIDDAWVANLNGELKQLFVQS